MPGVPRPDCVLLVLDATHMNRQLMLAAPVFSIGLPTLVLLNMSDQMDDRGGKLDTLALARELGHPVALISAAKGTGLDVVPDFLLRADKALEKSPRPVQLPVLQTPSECRKWATQVTVRSSYQSPAASLWTSRLDAVLLHVYGQPGTTNVWIDDLEIAEEVQKPDKYYTLTENGRPKAVLMSAVLWMAGMFAVWAIATNRRAHRIKSEINPSVIRPVEGVAQEVDLTE